MQKKTILMLLCFFSFAGCTNFDQIKTSSPLIQENRLEVLNGKYRLAPPDVIEIQVQDNPDIGTRTTISPDGNIFLPLLGDIYVEGLTLLEVRGKVHNLLGRFLKDLPEESVSVQVLTYNSKKVYVYSYGGGSVKAVPFTGDLRILDVIAQAAVLARTDNFKKIKVVRGTNDPDKNPQRLVLNLNDIVRKGNTEKNIVLMPNDVVYIPPTILGFVGYKLKDLLFPVQPVTQIGQTYGYAQTGGLGFNPQRGASFGGGSSFGNIGQ